MAVKMRAMISNISCSVKTPWGFSFVFRGRENMLEAK
jgi:hypothetical protein